ncbi:MAG TPA: DNA polymerase III subunit alpha [Myxococcota bacterium]|nr:DNA polymerase III subunit alpha [Myxococcota bacterium]HQP95362.1 DNA polymerase III subunit alpha [Myxococcota bacterium]
MAFVHLHVHSHYSLLNSTVQIEPLLRRVKMLQMDAVALTDTMNVFGSLELGAVAKKKEIPGIKYIYGSELLIDTNGTSAPFHLVVLCRTSEGFANLRDILSEAAINSPREDVHCTTLEMLRTHAAGLIGLSGCLGGEIPQAVLRGQDAAAVIERYRDIFEPGRFYLELEGNDLAEQKTVNHALHGLGGRLGVPCVATNNVHYLDREDAAAHAVLVAIQKRRSLSMDALDHYPLDSFHFADEATMRRIFSWCPEAVDNTVVIADSIEGDTLFRSKTHFFPVFTPEDGSPTDQYLRRLASDGLAGRLAAPNRTGRVIEHDVYRKRLDYELDVIIKLHFDTYYLVVWDFINWSRRNGVPVGPGRGSGAGSLVAYAIGITDVDPMAYDLLFERFLNAERISPPDFDIDFCRDRRYKTFDYVTKRYGQDQVCQIVTFGKLKAKAAIKDAARVLGFSFEESDMLTKMIPEAPGTTLEKAAEADKRILELCTPGSRFGRLWDLSLKIEGLVRQTGKHPAGVVIADRPIRTYAPLYRNDDGSVVTQYDMANLDSVGLIKFDFLGLVSLTISDHAITNIRARRDPDFDINKIPLDDPATFELICSGRTAGVFQLETAGITKQVMRMRPDRLEDIVAAIALFRPGPLASNVDQEFIAVKHGHKKAEYAHESLREILNETYGTVLYQEQVMLIAARLGGFSLGQADILRKGMGKKDAAAIARQRQPFIDGCISNGIPRDVSTDLFDKLARFAEYGFNKSHSVAYAYISYQMAYMKAHYPVEFICAVLYAKKSQQDEVMRFIHEAHEMGIKVLPPDVNTSGPDFSVEDITRPDGTTEEAIRFGLTAVKGVGDSAIELVIQARREGPFTSVENFLSRIDTRKVNRRVIESLIKAGAFDRFGHTRRALFDGLATLIDSAARRREDREAGQFSLFEEIDSSESVDQGPPPLDEWPSREMLAYERDALGYYVTGHPIDSYRDDLTNFDVVQVMNLDEEMKGQSVLMAGMVLSVTEKLSKKSERMAFVTLDDGTGLIECAIYARLIDRWDKVKGLSEPLLVNGRIAVDRNQDTEEVKYRILADALQPITEARRRLARAVVIRIDTRRALADLCDSILSIAQENPGPTPIEFHLHVSGVGMMRLRGSSLRASIDPSDDVITALRGLLLKADCGWGENPVEVQ